MEGCSDRALASVGITDEAAGASGRGSHRYMVGRKRRPWLAAALLLFVPAWCGAGIHWDAPWSVRANGQLLSVETFSSSMPPDAVARALARLNGAYRRYLVADGRIRLSGVADGRHWLAEVRGSPEGAQGYVSALYFDTAAVLHQARLDGIPAAAPMSAKGPSLNMEAPGLRPVQVLDFGDQTGIALARIAGHDAVAPGQATSPAQLLAAGPGVSAGKPLIVFPGGHASMALLVSLPER